MSKTHLPKGFRLENYQHQYSLLLNRIKYRETAIQALNQHLKNGTFPKRMKSLKPYPTMETPETQAVVNEACQQAEKVLIAQRMQEYERKLQEDRASLQTLKETRRQQRQQMLAEKMTQPPKPSKKVTVSQLQQELRDLQTKYTELSEKLIPAKPKPQPQPKPKDLFS